jgi:isopenicillin N synthase-like dioxygenase
MCCCRWKGFGKTKLESGRPDRFEFYSVSRDEILGVTPRQEHPLPVERSRDLMKSFAVDAHQVCTLILSRLDYHLGLAHGTLASLHPTSKPSWTTVRLIHMPPPPAGDQQASLFGHTDNGTITVLFNVIGGLQILLPGLPLEESSWRWIKPEPDLQS